MTAITMTMTMMMTINHDNDDDPDDADDKDKDMEEHDDSGATVWRCAPDGKSTQERNSAPRTSRYSNLQRAWLFQSTKPC